MKKIILTVLMLSWGFSFSLIAQIEETVMDTSLWFDGKTYNRIDTIVNGIWVIDYEYRDRIDSVYFFHSGICELVK